MKFTLSLTHNCNLSCAYCYAGRKFKSDMSLATAEKIVDFAMKITGPEESLDFGFFGGEPFLRFDMVKEITYLIKEKNKKYKRPIRFSVTTNGTILTQEIIDFLKENNFYLCISIDGPEHIHNRNRCHENGEGSFVHVIENVQKVQSQLKNLQVNAVYGPETIDETREVLSFLIQLGIPVIHLNMDIFTSWPESSHSRFLKSYLQVANCYVESYENGQEIGINLIDSKVCLFLKGGYAAEDICGMGETDWAFAPSGNIYPCARLIGEDKDSPFNLGNIHTGLNLEQKRFVSEHKGNHNEKCKQCELKKYCMNWCGCTNYHLTGHTDLTSSILCASERAAIHAAKHVITTLSENDLFINHFYSMFIGDELFKISKKAQQKSQKTLIVKQFRT